MPSTRLRLALQWPAMAQNSAMRIATQTRAKSSLVNVATDEDKSSAQTFAEVPPPSPSHRPVTAGYGLMRGQRRTGRHPFVEPEQGPRIILDKSWLVAKEKRLEAVQPTSSNHGPPSGYTTGHGSSY
jgi:hypothetical protein